MAALTSTSAPSAPVGKAVSTFFFFGLAMPTLFLRFPNEALCAHLQGEIMRARANVLHSAEGRLILHSTMQQDSAHHDYGRSSCEPEAHERGEDGLKSCTI